MQSGQVTELHIQESLSQRKVENKRKMSSIDLWPPHAAHTSHAHVYTHIHRRKGKDLVSFFWHVCIQFASGISPRDCPYCTFLWLSKIQLAVKIWINFLFCFNDILCQLHAVLGLITSYFNWKSCFGTLLALAGGRGCPHSKTTWVFWVFCGSTWISGLIFCIYKAGHWYFHGDCTDSLDYTIIFILLILPMNTGHWMSSHLGIPFLLSLAF